MQKFASRFIIVFLLLLAGCATLADVQRSTGLIRTDNELARMLTDKSDPIPATLARDFAILASQAKSEADGLKKSQTKIPDAIAYYRIAATAYWQSENPELVNTLFEVTENGADLCASLGEKAPDRDCLFLRLVIPFAGLEFESKRQDLSGLLDSVNFNDKEKTAEEIETMGKIRDSLNQTRPVVEKIMAVGEDKRLLTHPGMKTYFCANAVEARQYYDSTAAVFVTKVKEYQQYLNGSVPSLDITVDEARAVRKLGKTVPDYCQ